MGTVSGFHLNRLLYEVFFEIQIGNSQVFRTLFTVRDSIRTQLSPYLNQAAMFINPDSL